MVVPGLCTQTCDKAQQKTREERGCGSQTVRAYRSCLQSNAKRRYLA